MDLLKKLFPLSFNSQEKDNFIKALVIYIIAIVVCSVIGTFLGWIFLIGAIISIVCSLIGLYSTAGIILAILIYLKVI